ncbi:DUF305 domain-containing protein [Prauserella oleivorans]|uniref:DUF305 domain-containing protein n=1 Tax=Prauserella oleivorans TaxID=1478153 RepID=A0ABW5W5X0_9PSEU
MNKSVIRAALAAALGTVLATGCVGGSEAGPASSTAAPSTSESAHEPAHRPAQRQADVAFVRQMIPHHEGALAMARLVQGRTGNPAIVDLAGRVAQAQGPEIAQMKAWLRQWGVDQTETHGGTPGGNHSPSPGHEEMPGMGAADLRKLERAKGAEFDRLFLQLMIAHHEGAVRMSRTVLEQGRNPDVKALARRIIDAQEAEIAEMRSLQR